MFNWMRTATMRTIVLGAMLMLMLLATGCAHWWRRGPAHPHRRARVIRSHR